MCTSDGRINATRLWWRRPAIWIFLILFGIYAIAIFFDLPSPAGNKYQQNLSVSDLINWGAKPNPNGLHAEHWWYKTQALRGWSMNPEGWVWPKLTPAPFIRWTALLGLGLFGAAGLYWLEKRIAERKNHIPVLGLVILIIFAFVFQYGTLWLKDPNPEQLILERVTDKYFTGYLNSALQIGDLSAFFSKYDRTIRDPYYCSHCRTHPPGPVLFYWLLIRGVDRLSPEWQHRVEQFLASAARLQLQGLPSKVVIVSLLGGNFILLLAAAIVVPIYGLAVQLGGQDLALPLTALSVVLPGLILMSPEFDQVYATCTAGIFFLGLQGLKPQKHHCRWGLGAGLLFAFSLYWSIGLWILTVPLFLLSLATMAGFLGTHMMNSEAGIIRTQFRSAVYWLLGLGLGTLVPWFLLWKLGKFHILSILSEIRTEHLEGITAVRPYVPWVIFNLSLFLQFVGLPVVFATLFTLFWRRSTVSSIANDIVAAFNPAFSRILSFLAHLPIELNLFGMLFWGIVLALDLSGTTRGEVERIWIFLMPLALLPIYYAAGQGRLKLFHIHLLLAAQFIVCLMIGGNWLTP